MNRIFLAVPLALLSASPLAAQDDPYDACAALADDARRLACFDNVHASRATVLAPVEAVQREEDFGLAQRERERARAAELASQPADAVTSVSPGEVAVAEATEFTLTASVVEAFTDGLGKRVLLLENGQLWRETTGSTMRGGQPAAGAEATIVESWSGAFQLRIEGRRGFIRVIRMR